MLVRQRSAKKSRLRATSQVECAAPRRRPGLPRTPRSFLSAGPSPPRFWGLAAPRGATRGNRLNSSRLASVSNRTLDCLATCQACKFSVIARPEVVAQRISIYISPNITANERWWSLAKAQSHQQQQQPEAGQPLRRARLQQWPPKPPPRPLPQNTSPATS